MPTTTTTTTEAPRETSRPGSESIARPCSAWDVILISGGLQCGNCLAWSQDGSPLRHSVLTIPRDME